VAVVVSHIRRFLLSAIDESCCGLNFESLWFQRGFVFSKWTDEGVRCNQQTEGPSCGSYVLSTVQRIELAGALGAGADWRGGGQTSSTRRVVLPQADDTYTQPTTVLPLLEETVPFKRVLPIVL
jgi:hypothetical protein